MFNEHLEYDLVAKQERRLVYGNGTLQLRDYYSSLYT